MSTEGTESWEVWNGDVKGGDPDDGADISALLHRN